MSSGGEQDDEFKDILYIFFGQFIPYVLHFWKLHRVKSILDQSSFRLKATPFSPNNELKENTMQAYKTRSSKQFHLPKDHEIRPKGLTTQTQKQKPRNSEVRFVFRRTAEQRLYIAIEPTDLCSSYHSTINP